jgi:hypothetical protein
MKTYNLVVPFRSGTQQNPIPLILIPMTIADVTGLPASSYDVTVLGASYKLLSFLDAGRINLSSAEADLNDTKNPFNSGASASRYIFALYQQRLQEEALKLADKYPIRLHYTK